MKKLLWLMLLLPLMGYAQTPISALPSAQFLIGAETIPLVQDGQTRKATASQFQTFMASQVNNWTNANSFTQVVTGVGYSGGPIVGTSVLAGSTTATGSPSVVADSSNTGDPVVGATASNVEEICLEVNATSGAGRCGMPAGKNGIASLLSTMFIHAPGGIQTDAPTVPWPTVAYGNVGGTSSGACSVISDVQSSGIGSCTWTGTGQYVVTLTAGFTGPPSCTLTAGSGSSGGANGSAAFVIDVLSSNTVSIVSFNLALALQNNKFMLQCMGH